MEPDSQHDQPAIAPEQAPMREDGRSAINSTAITRLREIAGDDSTFLNEVFNIYLTDTAKRLVELRNAFATGDAKAVKRAAHTIKGSSLNVGADILTAHCRQLEQNAESGKLDGAAELIAQIEQESKRVAVELNRFLQ